MEDMSHVKVGGPPGFPRDVTFLSLIQEARPNNKSEFVLLENGHRLVFDDVWKRVRLLSLNVSRHWRIYTDISNVRRWSTLKECWR